jgi:hypothetical protein
MPRAGIVCRQTALCRQTAHGGTVLKIVCVLSLACLLMLPAELAAQSRQRRPAARRPAATTRGKKPATDMAATAALRDGRMRVAEKIKTITNFVYLYGRFSKDFENAVGPGGQPDAAANTLKTRLVSSLRTYAKVWTAWSYTFAPRPNSNASTHVWQVSLPEPPAPSRRPLPTNSTPPGVLSSRSLAA